MAQRYRQDGWLRLDDDEDVATTSPGEHSTLDLDTNSFLGAVPSHLATARYASIIERSCFSLESLAYTKVVSYFFAQNLWSHWDGLGIRGLYASCKTWSSLGDFPCSSRRTKSVSTRSTVWRKQTTGKRNWRYKQVNRIDRGKNEWHNTMRRESLLENTMRQPGHLCMEDWRKLHLRVPAGIHRYIRQNLLNFWTPFKHFIAPSVEIKDWRAKVLLTSALALLAATALLASVQRIVLLANALPERKDFSAISVGYLLSPYYST